MLLLVLFHYKTVQSTSWELLTTGITLANWSPAGVPDCYKLCQLSQIPYSANIAGGIDGDAYNLNVQNGGALDVQPNGTVTVQNFVDVDATGAFTIESEGSLIQVQDQAHVDYVANTGNIDMNRTANHQTN